MNQFEIHDKDGNAIILNELDRQACDLWGTQIDNSRKGQWASPYDAVKDKYLSGEYTYGERKMKGEVAFWASRQNWFDRIGWQIASGKTTWEELREDILSIYLEHCIPIEEIQQDIRIWGFVQLIELWKSKGYVPVSLDGDYNLLSKGGVVTETGKKQLNPTI